METGIVLILDCIEAELVNVKSKIEWLILGVCLKYCAIKVMRYKDLAIC